MTASSRREALVELAERCEAASGADRELDFAIAEHFDERVIADIASLNGLPNLRDVVQRHAPYLRYTASLDAAMSLVPEGWNFSVDRIANRAGAVVNNTPCADTAHVADAATPALALTAACLRAIAATGAE